MEAEGEDGGTGTKPSGENDKQTDSGNVSEETCVQRLEIGEKDADDQNIQHLQNDSSAKRDGEDKYDDVSRPSDNNKLGRAPDRDKLKKLDGLALSMTSQNSEGRNGKRRSPNESNGRKRKHRRKQKGGKHHPRKWKPYDKLTWEERKILEERESKRACKKRESQFASGQAMAPYNTTQFLMEQHEPEESELHLDDTNRHTRDRTLSHRMDDHHGNGSGSGSGEGSTDDYDSNDEEEIFLERDFTIAYEQYQAERLQGMTKEELVREYLGMEGEVEDLKRQLKEVNRRYSSESNSGSLPQTPLVGLQSPHFEDHKAKQSRLLNLQSEIQKLQEENARLMHENKVLRLNRSASENDLAGSLNL